MKKEIKIAFVVLVGFVSLLWFAKPLEEYLSRELFEERIAKKISGIVVKLILIALMIGLIRKIRLLDFSGLSRWKEFENKQAMLIPLAIIGMGIFGNWRAYLDTDTTFLLLFILSTLAVGVVEEFTFRGLIFPLFIRYFKNLNRPIIISAVLSSLMFGLLHFINLFSEPENISGVTSQVIFATSIGVFFCGLMLRTKNILIPCILHALVNFSFGTGELKQSVVEFAEIEEISGINWSSVLPTMIFFSFIFLGGVYMILQTDRKSIIRKLEQG